MNLNDLLADDNSAPSFIAKDIDPEKHEKVVATLCEKRKLLEETVALKGDGAADAIVSLFQLKNDMLLFGITEVEYLAYVEKSKEKAKEPNTVIEMESLDSTG